MAVPYHEPSLSGHPPPSPPPSNKWGPYSGAGDFGANMVIILIILFCSLVLVLALNALVRHLLCSLRRPVQSSPDPEKGSAQQATKPPAESLPVLVFSAATKLAGAEAECSICLAEFADGDRVRVLPACNHGFHVGCIERWLNARRSCPTCRAACLAAAPEV